MKEDWAKVSVHGKLHSSLRFEITSKYLTRLYSLFKENALVYSVPSWAMKEEWAKVSNRGKLHSSLRFEITSKYWTKLYSLFEGKNSSLLCPFFGNEGRLG